MIEKIFKILDELVEKDVIKDYAVGGATALIYYSAPTLTEDIDVFVHIDPSSQALIDLSPIYEYLIKEKGAQAEGQYLMIYGFPLQFLVPYDDLSRDAFSQAVPVSFKTATFKIFRLEHLMAIMIQLRKDKYRERLRVLIKEKSYDEGYLDTILSRFNLTDAWQSLRKQLESPS